MTERKYVLSYTREPYWEWDHVAMVACQQENYGNTHNWFYCFRSGLNGFHARMAGAERHYTEMHAWLHHPRPPKETEYHLASFFFHVDSAFECLVFALNALGHAVTGSGFRNIADASSLRQIGPNDIIGGPRTRLTGYTQFYPATVSECEISGKLFKILFEQHNASKHRHVIYQGGSMRTDAPTGFWEALAINEADHNEFLPVHDIILGNDILLPLEEQRPQSASEWIYFEDVADQFFSLIDRLGVAILEDTKANVRLKIAMALDR